MKTSFEARWAIYFEATIILVFLGGFLFFVAKYVTLFPLVEYRQWIFGRGIKQIIQYLSLNGFFSIPASYEFFSISFSRSYSVVVALILSSVCGSNHFCHNGFQISMIIVAASFASFATWRLSFSRSLMPALTTLVVVLFSVPILDAIAWQATLLDKTAMLMVAVTLWIVSSVNLALPPPAWRINAVLLLFFFLAYNAKESSHFLAPTILSLLYFRFRLTGVYIWLSIVKSLRLVIIPVIYSTIHVALVVYDRIFISINEFSRVTGGDVCQNLQKYIQYIFNFPNSTFSMVDLSPLMAVVVAFVVLPSIISSRKSPDKPPPLQIWALFAFLGSMIIPIRTSIAAPFYLLIPMLYFGMMLGLIVDYILVRVNGIRWRVAIRVLVVLVLFGRVISVFETETQYKRLMNLSDNFWETLDKVRSEIAADMPVRIIFATSPGEARTYMFVAAPGATGKHALAPYLLPKGASIDMQERVDATISDVPVDKLDGIQDPQELVVTIDRNLELQAMYRGRR